MAVLVNLIAPSFSSNLLIVTSTNVFLNITAMILKPCFLRSYLTLRVIYLLVTLDIMLAWFILSYLVSYGCDFKLKSSYIIQYYQNCNFHYSYDIITDSVIPPYKERLSLVMNWTRWVSALRAWYWITDLGLGTQTVLALGVSSWDSLGVCQNILKRWIYF